ncbi:GFA family protein [Brevundimonas sp.]|uniref:GFA family protein n=1 Tax=Brevundimonas sp. TaxID=1871086 RepID=UPI003AF6B135
MSETTTHKGSCHCGAVAFEADMDLSGVIECNCTHCYRKGLMLGFVAPDAFRLIRGEDRLSEYLFNRHVISHRFCRVCGVEPFGAGKSPDGRDMIAVNVRTLDDVEPWAVDTVRFDGLTRL